MDIPAMRPIGVLLFVFFAVFALSQPLHAQSQEDDIRHLLEITGSAELGLQIADQIISIYADQFPTVDAAVWSELRALIQIADVVDATVDIYRRHLSHDEILLLIAFYETDIGQKLVRVLPVMTQESMEVGQRLGAEWAIELSRMLIERGYGQKQ